MLHEANLFFRNVRFRRFWHSILHLPPHGFTLTFYRCGVRYVLLESLRVALAGFNGLPATS
jgi:hypothetical protein